MWPLEYTNGWPLPLNPLTLNQSPLPFGRQMYLGIDKVSKISPVIGGNLELCPIPRPMVLSYRQFALQSDTVEDVVAVTATLRLPQLWASRDRECNKTAPKPRAAHPPPRLTQMSTMLGGEAQPPTLTSIFSTSSKVCKYRSFP